MLHSCAGACVAVLQLPPTSQSMPAGHSQSLGEATGWRQLDPPPLTPLVHPLIRLQGRRVLVVCNLKPAKMRDVMSYGMVSWMGVVFGLMLQ